MMNTNMNMMIKLVYVDAENTGDSLRKNDQLHYQEDVKMSGPEHKVYKFDEPVQTKSGEYVGVLWRKLQEKWQEHKTASLKDDRQTMIITAREIQDIQDDLGLTVNKFDDIADEIKKLRNKSR